MLHSERKQIDVGDLLRSVDQFTVDNQGIQQTDIVGPKLMMPGFSCAAKECDRSGQADWAWVGGLRDCAQKTVPCN